MGGSGNVNSGGGAAPATALRIQTSVAGKAIPIGWGQSRIAGNLLWYGDFASYNNGGGGKGGGKGGGSSKGGGSTKGTTYTAAAIVGLCEGPIDPTNPILTVWHNQTVLSWAQASVPLDATTIAELIFNGISSANSLNLSVFTGTYSQTPAGYVSSSHPTQARDYRGIAYVIGTPIPLGNSPELPNLNFEVRFAINSAIPGLPDADPKDVLVDYLTNAHYGVQFPAGNVGDLSAYSSYCRAVGLVVSPTLVDQQEGRQLLTDMFKGTNSEAVWSSGVLTVVPYGDQAVTANGASYVPASVVYSVGDKDYKLAQPAGQNNEPVQCSIKAQSEVMNSVPVEYLDRNNSYNPTIVEAKDEASIQSWTIRKKDLTTLHLFCNAAAATMSASLLLGRELVSNTYTFTVGQEYIMVDPMDMINISDAGLGLVNTTVRVKEITENDDGTLTMIAEEYLAGTGAAPLYGAQASNGYTANYSEAPGPINTPIIFEPTAELAEDLEVDMALSGGPLWGGCQVWISGDGESYAFLDQFEGESRMGALTAALPAVAQSSAGVTLDNVNTLSVDISEVSGAQLLSGSQQDMVDGNTLCYVDGEFVSYQTATLTASGKYNLTTLRRGMYGTSPSFHNPSTNFIRMDGNLFRMKFASDRVGSTVYFKFLSFNRYGGGTQQLADVPAYPYVIQGTALASPLPDVTNLSVNYSANLPQLSWTEVNDFRTPQYEVRMGGSWIGGQTLGRVAHPPFTVPGPGTYWVSAVSVPTAGLLVYSQDPQSVLVTAANTGVNLVAQFSEAAAHFTGTFSGYAAYDEDHNDVVLEYAGDFLALTDITATPDILSLGSVGSPGSYQVGAAREIDVGRIVSFFPSIVLSAIGQVAGSNILTVTDYLGDTDVLGVGASANVSFTTMIQVADATHTWGAWQLYKPGAYIGRYARWRVDMASSDPKTQALLEDVTWGVYVPDRIDDYVGLAVSALGTALTYVPNGAATPAPFNAGPAGAALPNVQVTIVNAQAGDTANVTAQTLSGCNILVTNAGIAVARTVNVLVKGY